MHAKITKNGDGEMEITNNFSAPIVVNGKAQILGDGAQTIGVCEKNALKVTSKYSKETVVSTVKPSEEGFIVTTTKGETLTYIKVEPTKTENKTDDSEVNSSDEPTTETVHNGFASR